MVDPQLCAGAVLHEDADVRTFVSCIGNLEPRPVIFNAEKGGFFGMLACDRKAKRTVDDLGCVTSLNNEDDCVGAVSGLVFDHHVPSPEAKQGAEIDV